MDGPRVLSGGQEQTRKVPALWCDCPVETTQKAWKGREGRRGQERHPSCV